MDKGLSIFLLTSSIGAVVLEKKAEEISNRNKLKRTTTNKQFGRDDVINKRFKKNLQRYNSTNINDKYVNETLLISSDPAELQKTITELRIQSKLAGLDIRNNKSKTMTNRGTHQHMLHNEKPLVQVK